MSVARVTPMACGSVYGQEQQRALAGLSMQQPPQTDDAARITQYTIREGNGHEAIRFLQLEHERVLAGLHTQVASLQHKCDDLQFEAHLRHVTAKDDTEFEDQIAELRNDIETRDATIVDLQQKLEKSHKDVDELREQGKWRELQLQQQINVGEQKIALLKEECLQLRAKVRDLKVYSAALRKGDSNTDVNDQFSRPQSSSSNAIIENPSQDHSNRTAQPTNLEPESSSPASWRETRFYSSLIRRSRRTSGSSIDKQQPLPPPSLSLNSSMDLSLSPLLSRRGSINNSSRPGSVVLPPINLSQSVGRPQFRQHMRFAASAPPIDSKPLSVRRRGSDATIQRRKQME